MQTQPVGNSNFLNKSNFLDKGPNINNPLWFLNSPTQGVYMNATTITSEYANQ